ncbi:hypothetical protein P691DRAFT_578022 [Macrolepiota fuliginosa MF-IS2]|uniref:Secreted protein n=1 Tax=Macrolepiota fuliginosa MF-IS2 TaxID=1400762 RepID=A0A9P5XGK5_9AGAR|nr:hypothetical protein P691DRAFT_578022 [Macrolepiota fuliginosa MF-IS2]
MARALTLVVFAILWRPCCSAAVNDRLGAIIVLWYWCAYDFPLVQCSAARSYSKYLHFDRLEPLFNQFYRLTFALWAALSRLPRFAWLHQSNWSHCPRMTGRLLSTFSLFLSTALFDFRRRSVVPPCLDFLSRCEA